MLTSGFQSKFSFELSVVRLEAVKTCLLLLKGTLETLAGRKSQTVVSTVNDVLAKLLVVGITDMVQI